MFLSQLVAQQLAVAFKAREEFIAVMLFLIVFSLVTIAVLGIVWRVGKTPHALDMAALVMVAIALAATLGIMLAGMSITAWKPPSLDDWHIAIEMVLPALLAVAVQWWLVRRRRVRLPA
jgi:hypothetical protein